MSSQRYSVVLGGSSGVGRELVQQLAARGDKVLAAARDIRDLEALQHDCALRYGAAIEVMAIDFAAADFTPHIFTEDCQKVLGKVTHLFIPFGAISPKDKGVPAPEVVEQLTVINHLRPAQLLSTFCTHFAENGYGRAMIFSSIAASAPRGNNAAYAAAKAGLEFYCRALQHHYADSNVIIQICTLGYVDTAMSFGMKLLFPVASPITVARFALQMSEGKKRSAFFPGFWQLVSVLLRSLPWPIYKRLKF